jgi:hypothetical protein
MADFATAEVLHCVRRLWTELPVAVEDVVISDRLDVDIRSVRYRLRKLLRCGRVERVAPTLYRPVGVRHG